MSRIESIGFKNNWRVVRDMYRFEMCAIPSRAFVYLTSDTVEVARLGLQTVPRNFAGI